MIHLRSYARSFSLVCHSVSHRCFLLFFFILNIIIIIIIIIIILFLLLCLFFFFLLFGLFVFVDKERKKSERKI